MRMEFTPRFVYGLHQPRLKRAGADLLAVCGPDILRLSRPIELDVRDGTAVATFTLKRDDPHRNQLTGNFPQALSHLTLVNTALILSRQPGGLKPHHGGR